jgi:predicted PurR-regulated permease PerM
MGPPARAAPSFPSVGDSFYPRVFALITTGLLALILLRILQPFTGAILWSLLLAFLLQPAQRALTRALGGRPGTSALLLTLAGIALILIPVASLAVVFARQAGELVGRLQGMADRYHVTRMSDLLDVPILSRAIDWVASIAPVTGEQIQGWVIEGSRTLLAVLVAASGSLFAGALGVVVSGILTLFLLFFFLRDGEEMARRLTRLIPLPPERKALLADHLSGVARAVAFGALLTALVQGTLVGIAFAIVGLPSPVVFGVLAAVAALLPLIGTALIWAPAAGVLVLQGRGGAAIFLVIWGLAVVSSVDNFLRPLLISGRAQISTLPVFLGLLGGIGAFGPIGIVLGPVVVALALALLRFAEESASEAEWAKPPQP